MNIIGKKVLLKLAKNNSTLLARVNNFVETIKKATWQNDADLKVDFPDADRIFGNTYIFNLTGGDRSLIIVLFKAGQTDIVWAGDHNEYMATLKNNKDTIKKFLRKKGYQI